MGRSSMLFLFGESDAFFDNVILCSSPAEPIVKPIFQFFFYLVSEKGEECFLFVAQIPNIKKQTGKWHY